MIFLLQFSWCSTVAEVSALIMCPQRPNNRRYQILPTGEDAYTPSPYRKHSLIARSQSAPSAAFIKKWRYRSSSSQISPASKSKLAQQPQVVFPLASLLHSSPTTTPTATFDDVVEDFLLSCKKRHQKKRSKNVSIERQADPPTPPLPTLPTLPSFSALELFINSTEYNYLVGDSIVERSSSTRHNYNDSLAYFSPSSSPTDPLAYFRATNPRFPVLPAPVNDSTPRYTNK